MDRAVFNRSILEQTAHRPWPMPPGPWLMTQTWHNLLFAHWPIDAGELRALVPPRFEIDRFDGTAWLGVVPFYMTNVALRLMPFPFRGSSFAELNVRTYVTVGDKPGVFFFSLDAGNPLAVSGARGLLNLPYYSAAMTVDDHHGEIAYTSRRDSPAAEFVARYHGRGDRNPPPRGSLEYFLAERYCLYAMDRSSRPYRLDIHHPPWPLESARAEITMNTMAEAAGIRLPSMAPLLHFSKRQDTVCWAPERLSP
jgi:uncharacterized protein